MDLLEVLSLSKTYGSGETAVHALKNVSFSVPKGEFVAVVGESGSGKSTLLNLIGGLDRPDQGSILIDGKDIVKMKEKELSAYRARKIGFVFQEYNLLSGMTVEENLLLATDRKVEDKEIDDLLSKAGLLSFKKKKVEFLSGGEKHVLQSCGNVPDKFLTGIRQIEIPTEKGIAHIGRSSFFYPIIYSKQYNITS